MTVQHHIDESEIAVDQHRIPKPFCRKEIDDNRTLLKKIMLNNRHACFPAFRLLTIIPETSCHNGKSIPGPNAGELLNHLIIRRSAEKNQDRGLSAV